MEVDMEVDTEATVDMEDMVDTVDTEATEAVTGEYLSLSHLQLCEVR